VRWAIYSVIIVAAIIAIVVVAGYSLPKSHVATRRARFRESPASLFAAISGPPDWRPDVKAHEDLPAVAGRKRFRDTGSWGDAVTYEVSESTPPHRYMTRIADENLAYSGSWAFDILDDAGGSIVRITESGEVKNPIFRFMSRFVFGQTGSIESYLRNLGKKFGETVAIEE
jgi:hypothetical protein